MTYETLLSLRRAYSQSKSPDAREALWCGLIEFWIERGHDHQAEHLIHDIIVWKQHRDICNDPGADPSRPAVGSQTLISKAAQAAIDMQDVEAAIDRGDIVQIIGSPAEIVAALLGDSPAENPADGGAA